MNNFILFIFFENKMRVVDNVNHANWSYKLDKDKIIQNII